jgi:hypothetical protein
MIWNGQSTKISRGGLILVWGSSLIAHMKYAMHM